MLYCRLESLLRRDPIAANLSRTSEKAVVGYHTVRVERRSLERDYSTCIHSSDQRK
jgi:hypothetical protein